MLFTPEPCEERRALLRIIYGGRTGRERKSGESAMYVAVHAETENATHCRV